MLNFRLPFLRKFFFFCLFRPNGISIARHLWHLFVTGYVKKTLSTVFNISRITLTVLAFESLSMRSPLGLASNSGEAMMTEMKFIHLIQSTEFPTPFWLFILCATPSQKMRAPVTWDGTVHVSAKNRTFGYFDGTNPITGKRIQLLSPTLPDYGSC